jgi:HTH-type transcriptional repressor of NAD biosynthesis genes
LFPTGLVIGKFLPPHRGHKLVIDTALEQAQRVEVLVCARATDPIPALLRASWLREIHPAASVRVVEGEERRGDPQAWMQSALRRRSPGPAAVFSSEPDGEALAKSIGCAHVAVDPGRARVPCSSERVRADPLGSWEHLEPCVRAFFLVRVCLLGAESTGTTTMALALAEHYDTLWVPEYAKDYSVERQLRTPGSPWRTSEFVHVALEQTRREAALSREANRVLVCDTDALDIGLWHERCLGHRSPEVAAVARARRQPNLTLLTDIDFPCDPDGPPLERPMRRAMHEALCAELDRAGRRWALLSGPQEARLERAVELIEALLRRCAPP